ncbi:Ubiquitin protein [Salix suchowensis]|nr:Ubiquitin protein [Salix suchowensis]
MAGAAPDTPIRSLPSWAHQEANQIPEEAISALETYKKKDPAKVVVRFKAVGNAPIMKQNFYKITASNRFQAVIQFLRKELGWKTGDPLVRCIHSEYGFACSFGSQFTYINLAFSPAPDDTVSNLFKANLRESRGLLHNLGARMFAPIRIQDSRVDLAVHGQPNSVRNVPQSIFDKLKTEMRVKIKT